jgi:hypothetical protein
MLQAPVQGGIDMQRCWIDGQEYWRHGDCWVPRSHFDDCGEEIIYIGPPRPRRARWTTDRLGLAIGVPLYALVAYEMFLR